ncbi:MAG: hypothetical protein Q9180_006353, partial [Flavoplaca navasiana]
MLLRTIGRSSRQCNASLRRQLQSPRLPPQSLTSKETSSPLRVTLQYYQSRTYAKPPRPKKPYEYQSPSRHTPSQPSVSQTPFPRPPDHTESAPDYSKAQDEFGTRPESAFNEEPQTSGIGPDTTSAGASKSPNHPEYSKLQDEFEIKSSSDTNTAPQSSSPSAVDPAEAQDQQQQPSKPLPDLTQGIPSTLEAELDQAQRTSGDTPQDLGMAEAA